MGYGKTSDEIWKVRTQKTEDVYVSSRIPLGDCIGSEFDALIGQMGYKEVRNVALNVYVKKGVTIVAAGGFSF